MRARDNPFRVESLHRLKFQFSDESLEGLLRKIDEANYRGAISGPHGSGKTTLIEELMTEFKRGGVEFSHLRLRDEAKQINYHRIRHWFEETPHSAVLILDGAGLLNWRAWRNVHQQSRRFAGLIISTHNTGRLPTLFKCNPTVETFIQLVQNLGVPFEIPQSHLAKIFEHCNGNIRDSLRTLYDEFASGKLSENG